MSHIYPIAQASNAPQHFCIHHLLEDHAERSPDAPVILAPGRIPLTYGRLEGHVNEVVQALHAMGLGRNDRVALVLPNSPEMVVAFLSVAAGATCVPLNPAYSRKEFDFYLADLRAKALILQAGMDSPARSIAQAHGIGIIELSPVLGAEAGLFTLTSETRTRVVLHEFAQPDDVALMLHTAGTISRPKIVPLTQTNICTSAHNMRVALELVESDRCLNVMPLFHMHGLMGPVLASLAAGASVVCPPGFSAPQFFSWLAEFRPTWYTAVPTIHRAILARAHHHQEIIARCPLRFIRSGSALLPPEVLVELEKVFNAPVIEIYGLTEASGHITCTPPLIRGRKIGSVGVAAGPEVAIMDEAGAMLSAGETGEIVVRGATVFQGYENDPAANKSAFTHGWFRTGDQGYLDNDGYLFITGRLKEIINRGGGKVSPREVEEVLLEHPAVAQVAVFAIPHAQLGEDVAAAIVLREKASATAGEIREFAAARVVGFKVPRRVVFVSEIPRSATGKVQRSGLAAKLGLMVPGHIQPAEKTRFTAPRTPVETKLADIWAHVLGLGRVGVNDDFFELGGHSLQAAHLFAQIAQVFGKNLPLSILFQAPTVEQLAGIISQEGQSTAWSSLVAIQPAGSNPPFFCVHGHGGDILRLRDLARHLGLDQPFYGLQAQGLDEKQARHSRIEEMAAHYVQEIRTLQPEGPYFLGGYCFGGKVAFEMAQQLYTQGQKVALLAMFNAYAPGYPKSLPWVERRIKQRIHYHVGNLRGLRLKEKLHYFSEKRKKIKVRMERRIKRITNTYKLYLGIEGPTLRALRGVAEANILASRDYVPKVYPGRITLFRSSKLPQEYYDELHMGWSGLAAQGMDIHHVPGDSGAIVFEPRVRFLAAQLRACLQEAQATDPKRAIRHASRRA
jgi:acyl-CoA synthetase (AMP-forming)/AMP-acid ligase II/thioesterase domain-containing protein